MTKPIFRLLTVFSLVFFLAGVAYAGSKDPVGVLFQVKGSVQYSKAGDKWSDVKRNKFLFSGYQIKTGPDGSGTVTIQETGKNIEIGPNSLVEVTANGIQAKQGQVKDTADSSQLVAGLMQKFSKSQSYTTVRRSHQKKDLKIDLAREIKLSEEYPYVVWSNLGKEYRYQLSVGQQKIDIPATEAEMVRAKIHPFTGEQSVKIKVLEKDNVVTELEPFKVKGQATEHKLIWMDAAEKAEFQKTLESIRSAYGDDSFVLGSYFEKEEMWVAAMDQYKKYLEMNPDELEMAPYLFRVYQKLKLDSIYQKELEAWKTATLE